MSWWCDSGDRSSATCSHHGLVGTDLGSNVMVEDGALSINLPTIKYQPRKANVVADALSRSQRKLNEGSMDGVATTATMIERHALARSGVSVEITAEDLQQWAKAYRKDKGHVVAYRTLCQGQKYKDFNPTLSGLMARMIGGQQKFIVPKSLR